jgi:stage IV sporulation protein FB
MSWSFSIGTVLGSELRVHATFLLLLAWIGTAALASGGPTAALLNIAFVMALFACVVAHEFGHALMARRFGVRTPDITLLPIGGMARLERIPEAPAQEIAVALAGPAVNIVIWAALTLLFGAGDSLSTLGAIDETGEGFVARIAAVNLFLAVFNMIPAFPMDGGRVLRAALASRMDRVFATKIAATAGQAIAFSFGFLGLMTGNPLLLLIAIFVFLAAMAENSHVALHDLAKGYLARDAIITSYEALSPDASMSVAEAALLRTTQTEFPVLGPDKRLVGVLTKAAVVSNAQAPHPNRRVDEVMVTGVKTLRLTDPLEDVLDLLQDADTPIVAVSDRRGHFVGYVTRQNMGEWMLLNQGRRG